VPQNSCKSPPPLPSRYSYVRVRESEVGVGKSEVGVGTLLLAILICGGALLGGGRVTTKWTQVEESCGDQSCLHQ
jgi:hypothetical protein